MSIQLKQAYTHAFAAHAKTLVLSLVLISVAGALSLVANKTSKPLSYKPRRTRDGFHTQAMQNIYDHYKSKTA